MAVRLYDRPSSKASNGKAVVTLFADAKTDITSGMIIDNLPENIIPDFGSSVITASGDVGFLQSDGTWNWV